MATQFSSIAHFTGPIETQGEYLIYAYDIDGQRLVRLYRGTINKCQHVANLKYGKTGKRVTNQITGQRFGSVEKAIEFDIYRRKEAC